MPHRRRSIRLPNYDYTNPGAYFVTICAHERACLFGDVVDGEMRLNEWGEIVVSCLQAIPTHFEYIALDEYAVMPNHVHAVFQIVGAKQGSSASPEYERDSMSRGEAGKPFASPLPNGTISGSLGAVVQNFKSVSTRRINLARNTPGAPVWQRNYYEHVIRDDRDLTQVRDYIACNPSQWADDINHP